MFRHAASLAVIVFLAGCNLNSPTGLGGSLTWNSQISGPSAPPSDSLSPVLPAQVSDGVVLDAWQWKFSDIQGQLENIAAAGYTAIQVSPVEPTKTTSGSMAWYLFYQPCDLTVGNAQLGSEAAFQSLCSAAQALGIHIIVDAVLNQTADNGSVGEFDPNVASYIQAKKATWFHNLTTVQDWTNRFDETQQCLGNGPDWNTQNPEVQALMQRFLNECVADGASGFRFDAAKSIETSKGADAGQSWTGAGNFWDDVLPNLTNSPTLFNYGEVLQGPGDNEAGYQFYFRTTATNVIAQVSGALDGQNLTGLTSIYGSTLPGQGIEDPTKIVVYIENWDNYEGSVGVTTTYFSYNKRLLANAILTARAGMVNIVFARPTEGLWWDPTLVAVNRFRNRMAAAGATSESLSFLGNGMTTGTNAVLAIRRQASGTDHGIVLVNAGAAAAVSMATNLPPGIYTDIGPSGHSYTVASGILTGTVPGTTAVVLVAPGS